MKAKLALPLGALLMVAAAYSGGQQLSRGIAAWDALGPLPPGIAAPEFRLFKMEGGELTAADLQGSVSIVTFWATWCGVCRTELADLDALHAEYRDHRDVQFLAVNHEGGGGSRSDAEAVVRNYQRATGLGLPVVLDDGSAARAFRVRPIPHTVVFDRAGMIRHVHQGRVSSSTIRGEIDRLLSDPL